MRILVRSLDDFLDHRVGECDLVRPHPLEPFLAGRERTGDVIWLPIARGSSANPRPSGCARSEQRRRSRSR